MVPRRVFALMLAGLVAGISLPAAASHRAVCAAREAVLRQLDENYGERPVATGLASNGTVLEVLAARSGTWTILVTRPDGTSCVVAAGEGWEDLADEEGKGSRT